MFHGFSGGVGGAGDVGRAGCVGDGGGVGVSVVVVLVGYDSVCSGGVCDCVVCWYWCSC